MNRVPQIGPALCLALYFFAAVIGPTQYARAHDPGVVLPMVLQDAIAPFGDDRTETYTEAWGEGDYAYLGSLSSGVAIIHAANREALSQTTTFNPAGAHEFHDIRVSGDVGFFSSNSGGGTFVVDLTSPAAPSVVTQLDASRGGFDNVRNASYDQGYLYQVDTGSSQIAVFDVSDPVAPSFVRRIETGDIVGLFDVTVEDGRLYATGKGGQEGEGAVYIYDISNIGGSGESFITQIPAGEDVATAWPIHGGTQVLTTELKPAGNLSLWDLADESDPSQILFASAGILNLNSFSTAQVVALNDSAYVSWFTAGAQLIDLDQFAASGGFLRIGEFETAPGVNPLEGYVGSQSAFVWQGHDQVLLSDTISGLIAVDASSIVLPVDVPGDFNADGVVDEDDYGLWRQTFGSTTDLRADGNGDNVVDAADYSVWRDNAGERLRIGSRPPAFVEATVPEPRSHWLGLAMVAVLLVRVAKFSHNC